MTYLFYFGHPAQYLFLRETIKRLAKSGNNRIIILIKTKDVLENLLNNDGYEYINILPRERGKSRLSIAISLLRRNLKILPILLRTKPDLLIGTDAPLAQLGWLLNINSITITEDDYSVIKSLAQLTYPFTKTILCPEVCDVGKWENKKAGYNGYMKLAYLHPNVFKPDNTILSKYIFTDKYVLIRLARLTAHHDFGIKGINRLLLDQLISIIQKKGYKVLISSEADIDEKYQPWLLKIDPSDMHHVLAKSSLLICDSQSMSVEAAMLGIPSLRYSGFAGRISVLEELEHVYNLTYGIKVGQESKLISKLSLLLNMDNLNQEFQKRRQKMLADKIDVTSFLVWFIENYPQSDKIMKDNPDYQWKFK